jgi:hypothetical protein
MTVHPQAMRGLMLAVLAATALSGCRASSSPERSTASETRPAPPVRAVTAPPQTTVAPAAGAGAAARATGRGRRRSAINLSFNDGGGPMLQQVEIRQN